MKVIATKLDNSVHNKVIDRCNSMGCSSSEYIRNLIKKDLGIENDDSIASSNDGGNKIAISAGQSFANNTSAIRSGYIHHNSNPGIELVRKIEYADGRIHYVDTEGHLWSMQPDKTLMQAVRIKI